MSFMYKSLSSFHMKISGLAIAILKKRSEQNRLSYVKQGNSCVSRLRKSKRDYYAKLMKKNLPIINSFGEQQKLSSLTKRSQMRKLFRWKMKQLLRKMKKCRVV